MARDRDSHLRPRIREAARAGGVVLVVGDSTSGKTRATWEAVSDLEPRGWLFVPALGADLTSLPELVTAKAAHRTVVWLDDLDKHLNTSTGLDHTLIQRLTSAGALVIVTSRTNAYNNYLHTATADLQTQEGAVLETGRQLLRGLSPVRLERLWSEEELQRAATSGDTHITEAARRQSADTGHGVTEYLAAAPELVALWLQAEDSVGTDGGHPRGHRIVAAAVDLARIGVEHAPVELLAAAHAHYPLPAHLRPEPFAEALSWATQVQYGTCGLLIPATTGTADICWRPFDYFVDVTYTSVPEGLWGTALAHTTEPAVLASIGHAAYRAELGETAETAWIRAAESGDPLAIFGLGTLLRERGEWKEAESWYRIAAQNDNTSAMFGLGFVLDQQGETGEAEAWYRRAIEDGNTSAMFCLGSLLMRRGETSEAETWYRNSIKSGNSVAVCSLAILLDNRGETSEAETWYRRAIEDGVTDAKFFLGFLLMKQDKFDEAETWYRRAAEHGNTTAMFGLGALFQEQGKSDESEAWYRRAAQHDHPNAIQHLTNLLTAQGKTDEALAWHRRAAGNATQDGAKDSPES